MRELPILRAIVELADEGTSHITLEQVAARAELDELAVHRGLNALTDEFGQWTARHSRDCAVIAGG